MAHRQYFVVLAVLIVPLVLGSCTRPAADDTARPQPGTPEGPDFSGEIAMAHLTHLSETIGPRTAGSAKLEKACEYVADEFSKLGYKPRKIRYELPDGTPAWNITALKPGASDQEVVLAAHLDSVPGCPCANDNGTGVGAVLEIASLLREIEPPTSVRFLILTAEESFVGHDPHGYSSLKTVESLEPEEIAKLAAVCWLDKIGNGPDLRIMHIRDSQDAAAKSLKAVATSRGMDAELIAANRWSEKMAFEDLDIPTAWVEYGPAPYLHDPGDDVSNVDPEKLIAVGRLVYQWITGGPVG